MLASMFCRSSIPRVDTISSLSQRSRTAQPTNWQTRRWSRFFSLVIGACQALPTTSCWFRCHLLSLRMQSSSAASSRTAWRRAAGQAPLAARPQLPPRRLPRRLYRLGARCGHRLGLLIHSSVHGWGMAFRWWTPWRRRVGHAEALSGPQGDLGRALRPSSVVREVDLADAWVIMRNDAVGAPLALRKRCSARPLPSSSARCVWLSSESSATPGATPITTLVY